MEHVDRFITGASKHIKRAGKGVGLELTVMGINIAGELDTLGKGLGVEVVKKGRELKDEAKQFALDLKEGAKLVGDDIKESYKESVETLNDELKEWNAQRQAQASQKVWLYSDFRSRMLKVAEDRRNLLPAAEIAAFDAVELGIGFHRTLRSMDELSKADGRDRGSFVGYKADYSGLVLPTQFLVGERR